MFYDFSEGVGALEFPRAFGLIFSLVGADLDEQFFYCSGFSVFSHWTMGREYHAFIISDAIAVIGFGLQTLSLVLLGLYPLRPLVPCLCGPRNLTIAYAIVPWRENLHTHYAAET